MAGRGCLLDESLLYSLNESSIVHKKIKTKIPHTPPKLSCPLPSPYGDLESREVFSDDLPA
jgi:hypothetical protein